MTTHKRSHMELCCGSDFKITTASKSEIVNEYFESTTIHGLGKIHSTKKIALKLFWIAILFTVLFFLIRAIVRMFGRLMDYEVNVAIETQFVSEAMEFPVVTICNTIPFSAAKTQVIKGVKFKDDLDKYKRYVSHYWNISESTPGKIPPAPYLDYSILFCRFNGKNCSTSSAAGSFSSWSTGKCYTFNADPSLKMTQLRPGYLFGLSLVIYINQDDYDLDSPWLVPAAGTVIDIYMQGQLIPTARGLMVAPGEYTRLAMKKSTIKRLTEPYRDNCTDGSDLPMLFEGGYSPEGCFLSCFLENQLRICGCVDPLLFSGLQFKKSVKVARSDSEVTCIGKFADRFESEMIGCTCRPQCNEEIFGVTMSHSSWPAIKATDALIKEIASTYPALGKLTTQSVRNNLLAVDVYFEDFSIRKTINKKGYEWDNLASDLGGQLGLWIGASVFSVLELFSFLIALIMYYCSSHKRQKKTNQRDQTGSPKLTIDPEDNGSAKNDNSTAQLKPYADELGAQKDEKRNDLSLEYL